MAVESRMLALGTVAPDFALPDVVSGKTVTLAGLPARPLLVAFICNHCPFVKHILSGFVAFANEYRGKGLEVIAISSNDVASHPQDGPRPMAELARDSGFAFPYLYDESQSVARAYDAVCTPDFFLFDGQRKLVYRGQFDDSRPMKLLTKVTGADMRAAADAVLRGQPLTGNQKPSVGCSIKWKAA